MVQRQHPGDLAPHGLDIVGALELDVHGLGVLLDSHANLLVHVVEDECQPHDAAEAFGVPLAETELDRLAQTEGAEGRDDERF